MHNWKKLHPHAAQFSVLILSTWLLFLFSDNLPSAYAQASPDLLSLGEAYQKALETHELIHIADREVVKSNLLRRKANSIMLPHINLEGLYNRLDDAVTRVTETQLFIPPSIDRDIIVGPYETSPEEQYGGSISIQQNLYQPEYFPMRRAASFKKEQSSENLLSVSQSVMFDVATAFYGIVNARALVANAEELLDLAKKDESIAQTKLDAGKVTEDAVYWARLNRTRAERQLITASHRLKLAKETLGRLLGMQNPPADVEEPPLMSSSSEDIETLLQTAYENRYDYKAAMLGVKLAEEDVKLAKSKFYPSVGAEWRHYWLNEETYAYDAQFWTAGVKITLPLMEGGFRTSDLEEKRQSLEQAKIAAANLKNDIMLEVERAFLATITMTSVLANARQQVETASKNYDIVSSKFYHGAATALDLDQALTALKTSKTQLVEETYNEQVAILNLEFVIGIFGKNYLEQTSSEPIPQ